MLGDEKGPVKGDRPKAPPVRPEGVPQELRALNQWVVWRYEWDGDRRKWRKPPFDPATGFRANSGDGTGMRSFDAAMTAYRGGGYAGIGFVAVEGGGVVLIDGDHCVSRGEPAPWVRQVMADLPTYAELSPGGEGLHLFAFGKLPGPNLHAPRLLELYGHSQYLTVTGHRLPGGVGQVALNPAGLASVYQWSVSLRPAGEGRPVPAAEGGGPRRPVAPNPVPPVLSDEELIAKAMAAKDGAKFRRLWSGDWSDYQSPSEGDQALCDLLAFWTVRDPERMDRLFRASNLCRDKWVRRADYRAKTIARALGKVTAVYDPTQPTATAAPNSPPCDHSYSLLPFSHQKRTLKDVYKLALECPVRVVCRGVSRKVEDRLGVLAALCRLLAGPDGTFELDGRGAAEVFGVPARTMYRWLRLLVEAGVLGVVRRYRTRVATTYRYVGPAVAQTEPAGREEAGAADTHGTSEGTDHGDRQSA